MHDRVVRLILAALVAVPFLQPRHVLPLQSFYSEWLAIALGLCLIAFTLLERAAWHPFRLPQITVAPLTLIVVLLLQSATGRVVTVQETLLYGAGLLWVIMLMVTGRYLGLRLGLPALAGAMAWGLLAGSEASALIGIWQHFVPNPLPDWIFPRFGASSYGNLGQPNHQADYLWLGVACALYLGWRQRWSAARILLACLPLLAACLLTGSRSVFLYAGTLTALAIWMRWRQPQAVPTAVFAAVASLLPLLVAMNAVWLWLGPAGDGVLVTPATRLHEQIGGVSNRLILATAATAIFIEYPLLGSGVGAFPWQSFLHAAATGNGLVAEHAHNLLLHLAAEFGGPAALAVLIMLLLWWRRTLSAALGPESWWGLTIMAILCLHSLIEYPLWYAYFSAPAALVAGALDRDLTTLSLGNRGRVYVLVGLLTGIAILANTRTDYARLERISLGHLPENRTSAELRQAVIDDLVDLRRNSLLAPWSGLALVAFSDIDRSFVRERSALCEDVMRFSAAFRVTSRCALLRAIAGDIVSATALAKSILRAYPDRESDLMASLNALAPDFPEIAALRQRLAEQ